MPLVVASLTGRCQVSQSRGLCFQCLLQAGQRALSSLGCLIEVCLLGPRCCSFGPLSVTLEVSTPALLGNDSASFPRSERLVFPPWQLPCSIPSNDSFPQYFLVLAISIALLHSCFWLFIISLYGCPCLLLFPWYIGGFLHQELLQYLGNSPPFTLKCKETSLQLSKMKRWNSVSKQLCV